MRSTFYLAFLSLLIFSCQAPEDELVSCQILQINDVYEIGYIQKGKAGGLARVATLKQQLISQNPNTIAVIAGDFLNPSVIGTIQLNGERIKGKQMVETLNAMGLDYAIFGNHEFDLTLQELEARINESEFDWISTNVQKKKDAIVSPFAKNRNGVENTFPKSIVWEVPYGKGKSVKIGVIAVTLQAYSKDFIEVEDMIEAAKKEVAVLEGKTDFIIAITHESIEEDRALAKAIPQLRLIMGGHEHESYFEKVGNAQIAKADANAVTAFVHGLTYSPATNSLEISSKLTKIDETIPDEPQTSAVVKKWEKIATDQMMAGGINPDELLMTIEKPLDGLERNVRNRETNLTKMIAEALFAANEGADFSVFNAGSIRVDDQLMGEITQYDIVRILPFGGSTPLIEMKGALIPELVKNGQGNIGTGGLLHYHNLSVTEKGIEIGGKPLDPNKWYKIVTTEFLMSGKERNLEFLDYKNPQIRIWKEIDPNKSEIHRTLIDFMKLETVEAK